MRVLRGILFLLLAGGSLTLPGAGPARAEDSHPGGLPETCPEVLRGSPTGDLEKRTDPADGSEVRGGDVITVTLRWDPQSFDGPVLHKVLDCVTINGDIASGLSGQERDAPNDGLFEWQFTVPAGVPVGTRICDRGFVSGPGSDGSFEREKSNDICFTVAPPAGTGNGSPAPAAAPELAEGEGPPVPATEPTGSVPTGSGPTDSVPTDAAPPTASAPDGSAPPANSAPITGSAPAATPSPGTSAAPRTPEAVSTSPGPAPTGSATPSAGQPTPPLAVLASPPLAPTPPQVHSDSALPTTGATATPLALAGIVVGVGGICIMTGAGRRRRPRATQLRCP